MTTKSHGEFSFKVQGTNMNELRTQAEQIIERMMGGQEVREIEYDIRVEAQSPDGKIHLWAATVVVTTEI